MVKPTTCFIRNKCSNIISLSLRLAGYPSTSVSIPFVASTLVWISIPVRAAVTTRKLSCPSKPSTHPYSVNLYHFSKKHTEVYLRVSKISHVHFINESPRFRCLTIIFRTFRFWNPIQNILIGRGEPAIHSYSTKKECRQVPITYPHSFGCFVWNIVF